MCSDAKSCGESNLDVREVRSTVNSVGGVMFVSDS